MHNEHKGKLSHKIPAWVPTGSRFHIRINIMPNSLLLTDPSIVSDLLESALFYHEQQHWYAWLFLLMPNHVHAIISFYPDTSMSRVIGDWKRFQTRQLNIIWQENYFDHRLRNDDEFIEKAHYIRMNPVRKGLCKKAEDWNWAVEPWRLDKTVATERNGHPIHKTFQGGPGAPRTVLQS